MLQCKMIRCGRYLVSIRKRKLCNKLSVVALTVCGLERGHHEIVRHRLDQEQRKNAVMLEEAQKGLEAMIYRSPS